MKTKYGNLNAGDVFEDKSWPYLKTTKANTAVELTTGSLVRFNDGKLVKESDLILVRQSDLPSPMPEHLKGGRHNGE